MECVNVTKAGALKSYLKLVAALPRLGEADQEGLERRTDPEAAQALTESFLSYVVAEANTMRGKGRRFEALIAAGNRGLAAALRQKGAPLQARVRREVRRRLREALAAAKTSEAGTA